MLLLTITLPLINCYLHDFSAHEKNLISFLSPIFPLVKTIGLAAGATAALAAQNKTTPSSVPLDKIHGLLREHNAIVPEKS